VYALRQNWRTFDEGCKRPGELYAGTHGRGIWTSTTYLGMPDITHNKTPNQNYIADLLVYPNPMATEGNISFELTGRTDVKVTVYTINGRKVKEINPGSLGKGNHILSLGSNDLPSGTYFVDMQAGESRKTAKFIVTR